MTATHKEVAVAGGILRGKTIRFENTTVDLFLGVRYAEPPVGNLRFQKPQAALPWTGVRDALKPGNRCAQFGKAGIHGDEDCLFLNITVPGTVSQDSKKTVMVWIHGGAYMAGAGSSYYGAPLAVNCDVIVVTINYRLGIFGFLADGPGTGNYGLWDQRQALLWVKENIDKFGGDPEMVTIFGESAGAGSVSAQMMGRLNDGLFKRAIQQSGSLYADWSWWLSSTQIQDNVRQLKTQMNCSTDGTIFECLADKSTSEVLTLAASVPIRLINTWSPVPDGDFFSDDITNELYELAGRFDLLAGFNGQEGSVFLNIDKMKNYPDQPFAGYTIEMARRAVTDLCKMCTPLSVRTSVDFVMEEYGIESAPNDQERAIRLSLYLGDSTINADIYRQLTKHSSSDKSTYAYTFTDLYQAPENVRHWVIPDWLKVSAEHVEEIPFVWGMVYAQDDLKRLTYEYLGDPPIQGIYENEYKWLTEKNKPLTDVVMTAWTNFAKSGNPNQPVALPEGTPVWPQFSSDEFMELNSNKLAVISTPNKNRLDSFISTVFSARSKQVIL